MALYKKWLTKAELEAEANQIIDEDSMVAQKTKHLEAKMKKMLWR
jgi:hypothetical protein